jgi:hypothetical protein
MEGVLDRSGQFVHREVAEPRRDVGGEALERLELALDRVKMLAGHDGLLAGTANPRG